MARRYDSLIIGGGIIGCAIAEELARRKQRVALIERGRIGAEASSAAAGILSAQMDVDEPGSFFDLCQAARRLYPAWIKRMERLARAPSRAGYVREGVLYVAYTDEEQQRMERRARWQRKAGLPVDRWSSREICRREPNLLPTGRAGFFFPAEGQVDNTLLMGVLAAACRRAGVAVFEDTEALRLITRREAVVGLDTSRGRFEAGAVINSLGSWAGLDGLSLPKPPIAPARGQILVFDAPTRFFRSAVMAEPAYGVQRRDGRLLVGSTIEFVGYDRRVTFEGLRGILAGFHRMVRPEALAQCAFREAWAGLRPCSADRLPVLGPTGYDGLYIAAGHFRHGILLAPITAQVIADLVTTGQTDPSLNLSPFSLIRFSK